VVAIAGCRVVQQVTGSMLHDMTRYLSCADSFFEN